MAKVTIRHCRDAGYSPQGVKQFFIEHGLDWSSFVRDGIDSDQLRATGAGPAIALADNIELQAAITSARSRASKVGPMHSLWDVISDAEALLAGKPTMLDWGTRQAAVDKLIGALNQ